MEIENPMIKPIDDYPEEEIGECQQCGCTLWSSEEVFYTDEGLFCDDSCFADYHDASYRDGQELINRWSKIGGLNK